MQQQQQHQTNLRNAVLIHGLQECSLGAIKVLNGWRKHEWIGPDQRHGWFLRSIRDCLADSVDEWPKWLVGIDKCAPTTVIIVEVSFVGIRSRYCRGTGCPQGEGVIPGH